MLSTHSRVRSRTTPEGPRTQSSSHPKNLTVELIHADCPPQGTDLGCPLLFFQERSCEALGPVPGQVASASLPRPYHPFLH